MNINLYLAIILLLMVALAFALIRNEANFWHKMEQDSKACITDIDLENQDSKSCN